MEATVSSQAASPLMVSIGDTTALPPAKSPDTGQMLSPSSPFTSNTVPSHKASLISSSPPAANTAGSPLQNETHLSPSKESAVIDQQSAVVESADSVASSLSDVETFNGKIVYNPDGSAYIIEDPDSDGSEVEAEISQEGSIIDARGLSPHYGSICFPQIVSAFHISRGTNADLYSALCGQALAQNPSSDASKIPEVPVMHSYRVFSLRNKESVVGNNDYKNEEENGLDTAEEQDSKLWAANCSSVPVKPILMCFICKLSFGYTKSFVAHAVGEHHLCLNEDEKRVLSAKNVSAIIQGVGKEKEPLLSFLKPKFSPTPLCTPNSQSQQQLDAQRLLAVQMAVAALRSNSLTSPTVAQEEPAASLQSLSPKSKLNISESDIFSSESHANPGEPSSKASETKSGHIEAESLDRCPSEDSVAKQLPQADNFASELADLANLEKFAKAAAAAAQQQMDIQSIAAVMAAVQAASSNANANRTPSPGTKNSPKTPVSGVPTPNISSSSVFGTGNLMGASDCDASALLATSMTSHISRPTLSGSHPPLLMQHSRNSCKTLKCPKCNWHYKYQETLEIHMKEKHPENEMNCMYCLTNQAHPRLARGETYTCGYKPYRCDVCNYSTTTKGNLSIHMQSDKHINNVQELQNGNIPTTAEQLLQSQAIAAAVASAAAAANGNCSPQNNSANVATSSITSGAMTGPTSTSPSSTAVNLAAAFAASAHDAKNQKMSPQVSTPSTATTPSPSSSLGTGSTKQKATWRCDVCNYETNVARNLRIHMTSEKHTHNIMVLRQNVSQMQQISALQQAGILPDQLLQFNPGLLAAAAAAAGMNGPTASNVTENGGNIQPEAALADIAYNHALLMMASQQQQQRAMAAIMQQQMGCSESKSSPSVSSSMILSNGLQPTFDMEHPDPSLSGAASATPCDDSCRLLQCCVCAIFSTDSIEALSQHIQCDRTRTHEVMTLEGGSYHCKLCDYKTNLKANFQLHCKTDKHLQRLQHVNHIKEGGSQTEWKLKFVSVSNPVQVRCNVCDYYTNSIHKLQLHTANQSHDVRARIMGHLQGSEVTSNKYYFCSLCSVATRTKFALIHHISSVKHAQNDGLHKFKQQQLGTIGLRDADEEIVDMFLVKELVPGERISFENDEEGLSGLTSPPLAGASADSRLLKNAQMEQGNTLQSECKTESEQQSNSLSCPFCTFTNNSEVCMQMHILTAHQSQSQSAVSDNAPSILCPLCQEAFQKKASLENHLVRTHNVNEEGVQRLMLFVDTTELDKFLAAKQKVQNENVCRDPAASHADDEEDDGRRSDDDSGDSGSKLAEDELLEASNLLAGGNASGTFLEFLLCPTCNRMHLNLEELFSHMSSENHIKPSVSGQYQCWRSGCGQTFKTIPTIQQHFKEQHFFKCIKMTNNLASNAPVSDRHVYKYRCNQCSLAFKTFEKLQLHSQYHMIRAATQCVICNRSFRSIESLQKHFDSAHSDMNEEELEQYKASLMNNQLLFAFGRNGGILDPATTELLKKESIRGDIEDDAMDTYDEQDGSTQLNRENDDLDEFGGTDSGATCAMNGNASENCIEDYLNSQSLAEDNYNDPNRKFKCHRCKVAFTRQSYLTSHNKTLLHRKGEKMSYPMEKYLDPNRPFKCEICKESFTQKNILLVHYNSVSHLHKLKQSMKESSAAVAAAAAASTSTSIIASESETETESKVFRCNLCKVSYSQASAFNSHLQSFAHKSLDAKFQELAISGQLDLSLPLIEHPDSLEANNNNPTKASANDLSASKQQSNTPSASLSPSKLPEMLASLTEQQQQALAFQQAALNFALSSGQSGSGQSQLLQLAGQSPFTCAKCGAAFISQEAQLQHQQLCGLFGNVQSASGSQAKQIKLSNFQAPICKSKPQLYKHLLETWGFEIVMQFNESHQKKKKNISEQEEKETEETPEKEIIKSEESEEPEDNTIPEINRCQCDICSKEFSSIWVLKAHREEIHKDVLPLDIVESFADEYRTEYDRKNGTEEEAADSNAENATCNNNVPEQASAPSQTSPSNSPTETRAIADPADNTPNANPVSHIPQNFAQFLPPNASPAEIAAANQMAAAQLQFGQLLMSMGLAGMAAGMPMSAGMNVPFAAAAAMGIPPQLIPVMMADPMMAAAAAFNNPALAAAAAQMNAGQTPTSANTPGTASPAPTTQLTIQTSMNQSQINPQVAAVAAAAAAQQQKRARTRISDEQLKVLRQYFDINNSPTEEQLIEMSQKSGLPMKVIKHWFRNTLFKERQRNKDSPYNFNNPPSTFLNLDEYEKTGETKVFTLEELNKGDSGNTSDSAQKSKVKPAESESESESKNCSNDFKSSSSTKDTDYATSDDEEVKRRDIKQEPLTIASAHCDLAFQKQQVLQAQLQQHAQDFDQLTKAMSLNLNSPQPSESSMSSNSESTNTTATNSSLFAGLANFGSGLSGAPNLNSSPLQFALDAAQRSQLAAAAAAAVSPGMLSNTSHSGGHSSSGKRANRTRFTDYQIKVLQEFFESNAYPKDDDLEYLSKLLNLSPRVIVVWFQNARQKARKVYENQPAAAPIEDDGSGRFQRTPGLNYQCKKCLQVFQRYYELIKHQKSSCFKDENPLAAQIRLASESRVQAASPVSAPRDTSTPIDCSRSTTNTPEKVPLNPNMMASPGSVSSPAPSPACSNHKSNPTVSETQTFRCDKCAMVFNRYDLWKDHQIVHLVHNSTLFNSAGANPFGLMQMEGQSFPQLSNSAQTNLTPSSIFPQGAKRKATTTDDELDDESHDSMSGNGGSNSGDPTPRDKRLRTTILPEQLDYLYQKYQIESNPSRKMLESIAKEVGLKKRVVQVWFQNTRARERKGQFRAHQQVIHKRCPFCRALFKARSALESHLATRHADQYTKGDINIDALPDGDPSEDGDTSTNEPNTDNPQMADVVRRYEDSFKKYFDDLNIQGKDGGQLPSELALKMKCALEQVASVPKSSTVSNALDLSQIPPSATVSANQHRHYSNGEDEGFDDTRSEEFDSEAEEEIDFEYSQHSDPSSPSISAGNSQHRSISNSNSKRYRTQMTTVMLKAMKSIFADYKTPTMAECEALGREIGLPKRVVQVWFQNARAKEKKARAQFAKTFGQDFDSSIPLIEECKICNFTYNYKLSSTAMQEHLFSSGHIARLKCHIDSVKKMLEGQEDNSADFPVASGLPIPPTMLVNPHSTTSPLFSTHNDSKKTVNFIQQLQLIQDLAAASQGAQLPLNFANLINGDSESTMVEDDLSKSFNALPNDKSVENLSERDSSSSTSAIDTNFAPFMFGAEEADHI